MSINTTTIHLGKSEDLAHYDPTEVPHNFVMYHRHPEYIVQKWGNFCHKVVSWLSQKAEDGLVVRWYHQKIFDWCYDQYDKYGDYYVIINNVYGSYEYYGIYEVE